MLCSMYTKVDIYREVSRTDDWGNTEKQDNWQYDHSEQGFIQPRSGSFTGTNHKQTSTSTHVMYCSVDADIIPGDQINYLSKYYQVQFVQPTMGIGGIADHQEIDLVVLDDMS